jgi:hypothetical protein
LLDAQDRGRALVLGRLGQRQQIELGLGGAHFAKDEPQFVVERKLEPLGVADNARTVVRNAMTSVQSAVDWRVGRWTVKSYLHSDLEEAVVAAQGELVVRPSDRGGRWL